MFLEASKRLEVRDEFQHAEN